MPSNSQHSHQVCTSRVYTQGPVWVDDLQVGDVIAVEDAPWTLTYGPVVAIRPYVSTVAPHPDWRYAVFANGVEVTMTPGGQWFPVRDTPETSCGVPASGLVCPGCDEQVVDRGVGFLHRDGSDLCGDDGDGDRACRAGEPVEAHRFGGVR